MSHLDSYQILKKLQNIHNSLKQHECLLFIPLFKYLETFTAYPYALATFIEHQATNAFFSLMDRSMASTLDEKVVVFLGSIPFHQNVNAQHVMHSLVNTVIDFSFLFCQDFSHNATLLILNVNLISFHEMIGNIQECVYITWYVPFFPGNLFRSIFRYWNRRQDDKNVF